MSRQFAALFVVAVVSAPAWADSYENPLYKSWSKFKKGTVVTAKQSSDVAGQKTDTTTVYTLIELTADNATVEVVSTSKVGGQEFKSAPFKMENKKLLDLPSGKKKEDMEKPDGLVDQGEEKLKIAGKEYKAKWVKVKTKNNGIDVDSKIWTSDEVPGLTVKMETKTSGTGFSSVTTMEVIEIKQP
jgi:hypothetical protein